MQSKILVVEDDTALAQGLKTVLETEGYQVHVALSYRDALQYLPTLSSFQLVVLDVLLPDGNGVELCRVFRAYSQSVAILFLTACDEEYQVVCGLDAGGDDYIAKPFRLREMLSRVNALLRRGGTEERLCSGSLSADFLRHTLYRGDSRLFLTPTEFQLLHTLMINAGQVLPRERLLQSIWDNAGVFIEDNTLSVHISRLREKIGEGYIQTVRGVGYRWEKEVSRG